MKTITPEMDKIKRNYQISFDLGVSYFDDFVAELINGDIPELAPPFNTYYNDNEHDILTFYNSFFGKYLNWLKNQDKELLKEVNKHMYNMVVNAHPDKPETKKLKFDIFKETYNVCSTIEKAMDSYLAGYSGNAFESFYKTFSDKNFHLYWLLPHLYWHGPLYRVRNKKGLKKRTDLFHTPFHLRTKCDSYRFSIPGYPSLYLAGSLSTALNETGIVDDNYSCCVFYGNKTQLDFIDLTLPERINTLTFDQKYNFIVFYPLIVACGLAVKNKNDPFKPEYIIPQLFYQVIHSINTTCDGICYASTKNEVLDLKQMQYKNFALFVNYANQEKGYSEKLSSKLLCSKPISPRKNEKNEKIIERLEKSEFDEVIKTI